jgi:hypothetical protein
MRTTGTEPEAAMLIAGVGTAGTLVSEMVARQHPEITQILVDHDTVEPHNVPKSALYRPTDGGRLKVTAAAAHLRRISPETRIVPIPQPLEAVRTGPFRIGGLAISCLDNRPAKLSFNRFGSRAGTSHLLVIELEGDGSLAGRLRRFSPGGDGDGACLECGWSREAYADLRRFSQPCSQSDGEPGLPTRFGPAARLAAEALDEIERCLAGRPSLEGGEELRLVPEQRAYFTLRMPPRPDCLCPHSPAAPLVWFEGWVSDYRVADLIDQANSELEAGWVWRLPEPVRRWTCLDCRQPALQRYGPDGFIACPWCGSDVRLASADVTSELDADDLAPLADRRLAHLWPPGDILRFERASGEAAWVGLPLAGLLDWWEAMEVEEGER